jgi:site-specific DNA-methyltransferase (adenine-specific)
MPTLEPGSIDLVLADPPYGITACKWDSVIPLPEMWACLERLKKPTTPIVLTAAQPFTTILGASGLPWLRYAWVWKKSKPAGRLNAKRMPMGNTEDVLIFYETQPTYNPQGTIAYNTVVRTGTQSDNYGAVHCLPYVQEVTDYPRTLLEFKSVGSGLHPTQKPVALMEYLIRTYTKEGDTVLDFCMGSGTTGVACRNTWRKFIGIEKDEKFFQIANDRLDAEESRMPLFSTA